MVDADHDHVQEGRDFRSFPKNYECVQHRGEACSIVEERRFSAA